MTKQREAVLNVIRSRRCHYTADEILAEARKLLPSISRATVYNSLHYLEKERFIRRISGEGGRDRYDGSFIPHGHLYCTSCGSIRDFELPGLNGLLSCAASGEFEDFELKVRYTCPDCRMAKA